jgi:hypothetical protein
MFIPAKVDIALMYDWLMIFPISVSAETSSSLNASKSMFFSPKNTFSTISANACSTISKIMPSISLLSRTKTDATVSVGSPFFSTAS